MTKEIERLNRLRRRLEHLQERIDSPRRSENATHWDRSEASALQWAIRVSTLAMSNAPNVIEAAQDDRW